MVGTLVKTTDQLLFSIQGTLIHRLTRRRKANYSVVNTPDITSICADFTT